MNNEQIDRMMATQAVLKVYEAIANVSADMAREGIKKEHKNQQQNYQFRGIDDVYNALAGMLVKHKLVILPTVEERTVVQRETKAGGSLTCVTVRVRYAFVSVLDGSKHEVVTYGEAMDSADKATNKAMSAAYKYAAFQTFCIPTEGDNDGDNTTPPSLKADPDSGGIGEGTKIKPETLKVLNAFAKIGVPIMAIEKATGEDIARQNGSLTSASITALRTIFALIKKGDPIAKHFPDVAIAGRRVEPNPEGESPISDL